VIAKPGIATENRCLKDAYRVFLAFHNADCIKRLGWEDGMLLLVIILLVPVLLFMEAVFIRAACHMLGLAVPQYGLALRVVVVSLVLGLVVQIPFYFIVFGEPTLARQMGEQQLLPTLVMWCAGMIPYALVYSRVLDGVSFLDGVKLYWIQIALSFLAGLVVCLPCGFILGLLGSQTLL
jgi:hypothetical protein